MTPSAENDTERRKQGSVLKTTGNTENDSQHRKPRRSLKKWSTLQRTARCRGQHHSYPRPEFSASPVDLVEGPNQRLLAQICVVLRVTVLVRYRYIMSGYLPTLSTRRFLFAPVVLQPVNSPRLVDHFLQTALEQSLSSIPTSRGLRVPMVCSTRPHDFQPPYSRLQGADML